MPVIWMARYIILLLSFLNTTQAARERGPFYATHQKGVVHGVNTTDEDGHVYVRREVRDLKENYPDQWTLYLLALEKLQAVDQDDPYSYYSLASIHGRPYRVWEDAPGLPEKLGTAAYCPHSNELFLGWHRPYVALFEQVLHGHMEEIALDAPSDDVERYSAAAASFRLPYWDWGLGDAAGVVPEFFMKKTISIVDLAGSKTTMRNPLYSYRFHPLVPNDFENKWKRINETIRWPESDNVTSPSRQDIFAKAFTEQSSSLIGAIELAFRTSSFSRWSKQLEDPHGWVHGIIGGGWEETQSDATIGGHMWPLEYSAFEPLFMLHHTNVDRLWALFQVIKPNATMQNSLLNSNGNVYLESGQSINETTALLPFRRDSGRFWTTKDCYNTTVLGYVYPETQSWQYESSERYKANVTSTIAKLYGSKTRNLLMDQDHPATGAMHASLDKDHTFTDWMIESSAHASTLPPTFMVRYLLVANASSDAGIDVGTWTRLMPSMHAGKMQERTKQAQTKNAHPPTPKSSDIIRGTTGLTTHLMDQIASGQLRSLKPEHVIPYLTERLVWKVLSGNGNHVSGAALQTLQIEVTSTQGRIPEDPGALIEYGEEKTTWPEVTRGKNGGVVF